MCSVSRSATGCDLTAIIAGVGSIAGREKGGERQGRSVCQREGEGVRGGGDYRSEDIRDRPMKS